MKMISLAGALVGCVVLVWFGIRWTSEGDHRSHPSTALSSEAPEASPQREALTAAHSQVTREATPASMEMSPPSAPHEETPAPVPDDLRIRVIDSTSGACTDLVAVRVYWIPTSGSSDSQKQLFEGRPDGPGLEVRLARAAIEVAEYGPPPQGHLQIIALGAFVPEVSMRVLLQPWPTEPIELVLPPHCVVRFRAPDEMGSFSNERGHVTAEITLSDRPQRVVRAAMQDGVSEALVCVLGLELRLSGRLESGRRVLSSIEHVPNQPGTVHWIDLQLSALPAVMRVKLVLESGEPLRNVDVNTSTGETRKLGGGALNSSSEGSNRTDGNGYLQWVLDAPSAVEGLKRSITFTHEQEVQGLIAGYLDYSQDFSSGTQDLGEVAMMKPPVLASGVVVNSAGRAVRDASVNASFHQDDRASYVGAAPSTTTNSEGYFELRSVLPLKRLKLNVRAQGFAIPEILEVLSGTQNIVVTLVDTASLVGSFLLPAGMDPTSISIAIEDPEYLKHGYISKQLQLRFDALGEFTARDIRPGTATLHIALRGADRLLSVPDLDFVAGEVNRDPRLQNVRLCSGWRQLRLRLLDEKQAAVARRTFGLVSDNGDLARTLTTDREGLCTTWIEPQHRRFTIHAERFRSTTLEWSEDIQVLQLSPGLRVTVPIQVELLPPITGIDLRLATESAKSASATVIGGVAEVLVSAPGRHRVIPELRIHAEGITMRLPWEPDPPIFIDIEDKEMQSLPTIHITKEMMQAVLDRH